jgi:hypothetical protein
MVFSVEASLNFLSRPQLGIRPSFRCRLTYRPDYPRRPLASKEEASQWVAAFVGWYFHEYRHSAIRFVTPQHRHSGQAPDICQKRTLDYEQARQRHPRCWSRSIGCWQQPDAVWINQRSDSTTAKEELLFLEAA